MEIVLAYDRQEEMRQLIREYTDAILGQGEEVRQCLSSQRLEDELADMEKKYGPPGGRMYLALVHGQPAGCAALAGSGDEYCEIKRLFVRPQYRGLHISGALIDRVVADARGIGYRHMRLDTFPFMESAIRLYRRYGFYPIARYNDNPAKTAIFMQLDL